jgi:hypothetical protein
MHRKDLDLHDPGVITARTLAYYEVSNLMHQPLVATERLSGHLISSSETSGTKETASRSVRSNSVSPKRAILHSV